jgi:hypothetical protein
VSPAAPRGDDPRAAIVAELAALEGPEEAVVLLAVESGSRAWGFPSADSDYDVRFVYVRPPEWYLSIEMARLDGAAGDQPSPEVPVAPLDELFRATLAEAWPGRGL